MVSRGVHPAADIASISSERLPDRAFLPSAFFVKAGVNFAASASFTDSGFSKSSFSSSVVEGAVSAEHAQSARIGRVRRDFAIIPFGFAFSRRRAAGWMFER